MTIAGFKDGRRPISSEIGLPLGAEKGRKYSLSSRLQKEHSPADTLILAHETVSGVLTSRTGRLEICVVFNHFKKKKDRHKVAEQYLYIGDEI